MSRPSKEEIEKELQIAQALKALNKLDAVNLLWAEGVFEPKDMQGMQTKITALIQEVRAALV